MYSGSVHTALVPPSHPPYEKVIDLRIQLHFSSTASVHAFAEDDERYKRSKKLCKAIFQYGKENDFDNGAFLSWASIGEETDDDGGMSSLFFAVYVEREDVGKCRIVHQGLRKMIQEEYRGYSEFEDPVIRYFVSTAVEY